MSDIDLDRTARLWLQDGPDQLADRVLEAALDEIHVTRQRRVWGPARKAPIHGQCHAPGGVGGRTGRRRGRPQLRSTGRQRLRKPASPRRPRRRPCRARSSKATQSQLRPGTYITARSIPCSGDCHGPRPDGTASSADRMPPISAGSTVRARCCSSSSTTSTPIRATTAKDFSTRHPDRRWTTLRRHGRPCPA